MPPTDHLEDRAVRTRLRRVARALEREYGTYASAPADAADPLTVLVETILSQNTTGVNCRRAFTAMRAAFPTWDDVLAAPRARLEHVLKPAGLARTRSARIKRILRSIQCERAALTLNHLHELSDDDALNALLAYDGVGPKTAGCVLLFALGRDVFPVDTHIHRILTRLLILPAGMRVEKAQVFLRPLVPRGAHLDLHLSLITHGRTICRPRNPTCATCVVQRWCSVGSPLRR